MFSLKNRNKELKNDNEILKKNVQNLAKHNLMLINENSKNINKVKVEKIVKEMENRIIKELNDQFTRLTPELNKFIEIYINLISKGE